MYSPVIDSISFRLLFALTIIHDLESCSIDFILAFPQAKLKEDVYMELPFGFDQNGNRSYTMKLNKPMYGLKQASRNWFDRLPKD